MRRSRGLLLLLAALPLAARAGEARTQFGVSAYVLPRASLERSVQPGRLVVTAQDVSRGYVDVTSTYEVSGQGPAGYIVRLEPRTGLTTAVEVTGLASPVVMGDETVEVVQPAISERARLNLGFRLQLAGAARPGTYEFPVHIRVDAL